MKEFINNCPCWVCYIHPLSFIIPDGEEKLNITLQEINSVSYNHGELVRIVSSFKLPNSNIDGLICYDGAIAIPRNDQFRGIEQAVNYFNDFLAKLLVSEFYVEGVDVRDIVTGRLNEKWSIWPVDLGYSAASQLHSKIRMRMASNTDTILLSNPRSIFVSEFKAKVQKGERILSKVPLLNSKYLTKGVSEVRYKSWDLVLSNLWITAEQLIDFLWNNLFLSSDDYHPNTSIINRKNSMKDDSRTWTMSVKQEILFQSKIISGTVLEKLFSARQARNKLVHEGKPVDEKVAKGLLSAIEDLLTISTKEKISLFDFERYKGGKISKLNVEISFDDWISISGKEIVPKKYKREK